MNRKLFFFLICCFFVQLNECEIFLKVFSSDSASDEGFLYKKLENNSFFQPIKFRKIKYEVLRSFCIQMNYLALHAVSFPKKLNKNEKTTYVIATCIAPYSCNLYENIFVFFFFNFILVFQVKIFFSDESKEITEVGFALKCFRKNSTCLLNTHKRKFRLKEIEQGTIHTCH